MFRVNTPPPMVWSPMGLAPGLGLSIMLCKTTSHPMFPFSFSLSSMNLPHYPRIQHLQRLPPSSTINHTLPQPPRVNWPRLLSTNFEQRPVL